MYVRCSVPIDVCRPAVVSSAKQNCIQMSLPNGMKMAEKTRVCVIGVDDSDESAYVFDCEYI